MIKIEVIPNVISVEEADILLRTFDPITNGTDDFYFKDFQNFGVKKVKNIEHEIIDRILNKVGISKDLVDNVSILYYPTGAYNPRHADNSVTENGVVRKFKDWTRTGIVFLNNEFSGGELIYPDQGCVFLPVIGNMVITPADSDYTHMVSQVTSGSRFTLVFRFL